jgi:hypothetical protein
MEVIRDFSTPKIKYVSKTRPTKRAADVWESAAFSSIFLAWSFFSFRVESHPTHTRLTQTVGQFLAKQSQL